jgi:pimeloyl-ACP methyl ester carboxylesterase
LFAFLLAVVPAQAEQPADGLRIQVAAYLLSENPETADQLLQEILARPDATIQAVSVLINEGPAYRPAAVGMQPGRLLTVRSHIYEYGLYVPTSYSPDKSYGLVVCLHGAGFTGDAYLERWQNRLAEEYILACPTLPQGNWWTRGAEELVMGTIRTVTMRYHVDPDRIFLTGMSNGGIGAYLIGAHHATRFAAIVPMAAGLDDVLLPFLQNFRQTPLYIIHGKQDQVMPVQLSRTIVEGLKELGYSMVYHEHDRVHPMAGGHFFPREELPELIEWLGKQRRNSDPKRLTVVQDASHLLPFGWLRIDATDRIAAFTEGLVDHQDEAVRNRLYARLDAEIQQDNRIEVRTQRVRRYTLFLNERLVDLHGPLTIVTNGILTFQGRMHQNLRTLLHEARLRHDPRALYPASITIDVPPDK